MARPRKYRRDLPECVFFKNGAYYYVRHNKWKRLDSDYQKAMAGWAELLHQPGEPSMVSTVGELLDRYLLEVVPSKAERTQKDNRQEVRFLRSFFGDMELTSVTTAHVARYVATRTAKTRSNREVALLSHAFNKAILWGLVERNPCAVPGIRNSEKARDRYVTDEEITEFKKECPSWLKLYIELKLLLGLRQQDMLLLQYPSQSKTLNVVPLKTQNSTRVKLAISLTPELQTLLSLFPNDSGYLFKTRSGTTYTSSGFGSTWKRAMAKYVSNGNQRFHEHDLRGKVATEIEDPHAAQKLLGHKNLSMTEAYRKARQTDVVQPHTRRSENGKP
jgi:integrase